MKFVLNIVVLSAACMLSFGDQTPNKSQVEAKNRNANLENTSPVNRLSCLTDTQFFDLDSLMSVDFSLRGIDIDSVDTRAEGLEIHHSSFDLSNQSLQLQVSLLSDVASLAIDGVDDVHQQYTSIVHFKNDQHGKVAFSPISLEAAERNILTDHYERELISEDDYLQAMNDINGASLITRTDNVGFVPYATLAVNGLVSGKIEWRDDRNINHPLQFLKVGLYFHRHYTPINDWMETYTDVNGNYSMQLPYSSIDFNRGLYLRVIAASSNIDVRPDGIFFGVFNATYAHDNDIRTMVQNNVATNIDLVYGMSNGDFGRALQVAMATNTAARYATYLNGGVPLRGCRVLYPSNPAVGSFYSSSDSAIGIAEPNVVGPFMAPSYTNWDLVGEEYGHHVQSVLNTFEAPGYALYYNVDLCQAFFNGSPGMGIPSHSMHDAKGKGVKAAWYEGWACYFGMAAGFHFASELVDVLYVADLHRNTNFAYDLYIDNYYSPKFGEGNIANIIALLFKLSPYDTVNDSLDTITVNEITMFNIVKNNQVLTFSSFANLLLSQSNTNMFTLGVLLSGFGITPSNIEVHFAPHASTAPTLTWDRGGNGTLFPNTKFTLRLRGQWSAVALEKTIYNTNTYTLSPSEWDYVKYLGGIRAFEISGGDDNYFATGSFYAPIRHEPYFAFSMDQFAYGFPNVYARTDTVSTHSVVHNNKTYPYQINRLRTGLIENEYVVLSPRHRDAGVAYIEYSFPFGILQAQLQLGLWSANEMLHASTSTALVQYLDSATNQWVTVCDLLNDVTLSTDRTTLPFYTFSFTYTTFGLRIYLTSQQSGTANKGRLCLGEAYFN